jgi:hypothetical protein
MMHLKRFWITFAALVVALTTTVAFGTVGGRGIVSTFVSVTTGIIKPPADSASAVQIANASSAATVLDVDTTNFRVGINTAAPGSGSTANVDIVAPTSGQYAIRISNGSAKATAATEFPIFLGSNDAWAGNPFGLNVSVTGAAAIANRSVSLQTVDINSAYGGTLKLNPSGGTVAVGSSTTSGKILCFKDTSGSIGTCSGSYSTGSCTCG